MSSYWPPEAIAPERSCLFSLDSVSRCSQQTPLQPAPTHSAKLYQYPTPHGPRFPRNTLRGSQPAQEDTEQPSPSSSGVAPQGQAELLSPGTGEQSGACSLGVSLPLLLELGTEHSLWPGRVAVRSQYKPRPCAAVTSAQHVASDACWTGCLLRCQHQPSRWRCLSSANSPLGPRDHTFLSSQRPSAVGSVRMSLGVQLK